MSAYCRSAHFCPSRLVPGLAPAVAVAFGDGNGFEIDKQYWRLIAGWKHLERVHQGTSGLGNERCYVDIVQGQGIDLLG